jgi:hypothetical protein
LHGRPPARRSVLDVKDVRIDEAGVLRCWNCGSDRLTPRRTTRSKFMLGVWSLLKEPKLRCQVCDEYSDTGHAKPYEGPESRKYRKAFEAEQERRGALPPPPVLLPHGSVADELGKLAALRDSGVLSDDEFAEQKARLLEG